MNKKTVRIKKSRSKRKQIKRTIKKGGGSVSNGLYTQLNANGLTYKFPIYYFGDTINQIQYINQNMDTKGWNQWLQNYIDTRNPNSNFGSLTISESMK